MKKSILIIAVLGLSFASCKKDRVCSCKTVTKTTGGPVAVADQVNDYEVTMTKTSYRTAYNACIHTTQVETNGPVSVSTDINCSLK